MTRWHPQRYKRQGIEKSIPDEVLANALAVAAVTHAANPNIPPIFSLRHLAHLTDVNYGVLRAIASRTNLNPYRLFRIRKRASTADDRRYRIIAVPSPGLLKVQQWITQAILIEAKPHPASVAFSRGDTLIAAAEPHCRCRWLIKLDVQNFFESISEIAVYGIFKSLGYQPLVSFELARLCTRLRSTIGGGHRRWWVRWEQWPIIQAYQVYRGDHGIKMGHLPQGAPTSPMLANLAMEEFDAEVTKIADRHGMIYTRYADDLSISTTNVKFSREKASKVIGEIYAVMSEYGLSPNATKTRVASPGTRKVVLGLLVDGPKPKLIRESRL
jgi:RNA-directed DNA polymerase